jgi:hypothetical protein
MFVAGTFIFPGSEASPGRRVADSELVEEKLASREFAVPLLRVRAKVSVHKALGMHQ